MAHLRASALRACAPRHLLLLDGAHDRYPTLSVMTGPTPHFLSRQPPAAARPTVSTSREQAPQTKCNLRGHPTEASPATRTNRYAPSTARPSCAIHQNPPAGISPMSERTPSPSTPKTLSPESKYTPYTPEHLPSSTSVSQPPPPSAAVAAVAGPPAPQPHTPPGSPPLTAYIHRCRGKCNLCSAPPPLRKLPTMKYHCPGYAACTCTIDVSSNSDSDPESQPSTSTSPGNSPPLRPFNRH